jgi:amino acid transporter
VEIFSTLALSSEFVPSDNMADFEGHPKTGSRYIVQDVEDQPPPHSGPSRAVIPDDGQIVTQRERQSLIRGLGQRHIQMIAIAGAIVCGVDVSPHVLV